MMGRQDNDQVPLLYEFCLDEAVPDDHLVRKIDAVLNLTWVYAELAPHYSTLGRPSVDPVLMIRMLIIGYIFGLRSERLLCRELQVNLAYRWFCKLGIQHKIPDHSAFFLTSAAKRGASLFKTMATSRHRSTDTLTGYVRDKELFKKHAGAGLL